MPTNVMMDGGSGMLSDLQNTLSAGLLWGGLIVGIIGIIWTVINVNSSSSGGAQFVASIFMAIGGFACAGLSVLIKSLDTSWAG